MSNKFIPYARQNISLSDIKSVERVLKSEYLTQGKITELFEKKIQEYTNVKYASVVNSGTSALHLSCKALGLKKNDVIWTSPITFAASANCAFHLDANVDFVDIDKDTWCMSVYKLELKLKDYKHKNKTMPKIIIPVHLAGQSCDMLKIFKLSKKYGFKIIEDGSHAIGAEYNGYKVGSCKYSDITIFSFHAVKIITTGEGGAALTNNNNLHNKIKELRSHGITKDKNKFKYKKQMHWYYEQHNLGWNYRITEMQSALGISQLSKVDRFVKKRNKIANQYNRLLNNLDIVFQYLPNNLYSSRHLYVIRVSPRIRKGMFNDFIKNNIGVNLHYIPLYNHPYYKKKKINIKNYPESNKYYKEAISLPMHTLLTYKEIKRITDIIKRAFK